MFLNGVLLSSITLFLCRQGTYSNVLPTFLAASVKKVRFGTFLLLIYHICGENGKSMGTTTLLINFSYTVRRFKEYILQQPIFFIWDLRWNVDGGPLGLLTF